MGHEEVSALTGIPVNTLKDYRAKRKAGAPPSAVVCGKVRYRRSDVLAWIDEQFEQSREAKPMPVFTPLGPRRGADLHMVKGANSVPTLNKGRPSVTALSGNGRVTPAA